MDICIEKHFSKSLPMQPLSGASKPIVNWDLSRFLSLTVQSFLDFDPYSCDTSYNPCFEGKYPPI